MREPIEWKNTSGIECLIFQSDAKRPISMHKMREFLGNLEKCNIIVSNGTFFDAFNTQYECKIIGGSYGLATSGISKGRIQFTFLGVNLDGDSIKKSIQNCILSPDQLELGMIGVLEEDELLDFQEDGRIPKPKNMKEALHLAKMINNFAQNRNQDEYLGSTVEPEVEVVRKKVKAKDIALSKQVDMIKMSVRSKNDWKRKFVNEEVQMKYRDELLIQGALPEAIFQAFSDLLDSEIISNVFDLNVALDNALLYRDSSFFRFFFKDHYS